MVYKATKLVEKAFKENNIKCRISETENTSAVEAGFGGDNVSGIILRFISTDDDNDVAVRIFELVRVPQNKRAAVFEAINSLQRKYRYCSFNVDDDGDMTVSYDMPLRTPDPGTVAVEMFVHVTHIVDEAYPVIMKALWS